MTLKSDAKFEEKSFFCFKNDKISWILIRQLKSLKVCTLIGPFCANNIMFDLKKYRRVILHDTEGSCEV